MYTELESSNGWPWFVVGLTAWIWCSQCMAEKEVASSTNLLPLRWMQLGNPCSHGLNRCNREVQKLYGFKQHTFGEKSTPVEVEVQVVLFFKEDKQKVFFSWFFMFHEWLIPPRFLTWFHDILPQWPTGLQRHWFQEERCQHREPGMA